MAEREKIYVWRYALTSRAALNAKSARTRFEGALLRIGDGFACLHPWVELGDPSLPNLLSALESAEDLSPLLVRAFAMAKRDAAARGEGQSLFEEVDVPRSHASLPGATDEGIEEAVRRGFSIVKLKGTRDVAGIAGRLDEVARRWPDLRWRIDFNGVLSLEETKEFVQCLTSQALERIECLEDPCPYGDEEWEKIGRTSGLKLARDADAHLGGRSAQSLVVKPACESIGSFLSGEHLLIVTSYMDHPLGQCFAAVEAARLWTITQRVICCGLQTHELFEPDEFSECLGPAGPRFRSPGGTGLGFDDLLEKLPWKRLV